MHVLYFPLVTDDVTVERPEVGWTRQIVRDTANGWRCVLLMRPVDELDEYALYERTRAVVERMEACASETADSAYLLAQRGVKLLRESGLDAGDSFRYALLVSDGHKLHFFLKGFRCLLWGVPVEGSPPLRLTQEDKQNVIESRDFPSLQRRDAPQAAPFIAEPVIAVVDQAQPDGLLPSFAKTLENLLVLAGPVSLRYDQAASAARGDAAMWHLWEEMSNLAAVDLRRLEGKLNLLSDRVETPRQSDGGVADLWQRAQPWLTPALLGLILVLLVALLMKGPAEPVAPAAAPSNAAPPASAVTPQETPPSPAARALFPPLPGAGEPAASPSVAPASPSAARPEPAAAPGDDTAAPSTTAQIAAFLVDTTPTDRIQFTRPVKDFIDGTVTKHITGGDSTADLTKKARETMVDVAAQILTNRRCASGGPLVRVDGDVGERTLERIRECARDGDAVLEELARTFRDASLRNDLGALETRILRLLTEGSR